MTYTTRLLRESNKMCKLKVVKNVFEILGEGHDELEGYNLALLKL